MRKRALNPIPAPGLPDLSPKVPVPEVRHGGHFVDQQLIKSKTTAPVPGEYGEITVTRVGIDLSPAEKRLVNALFEILHEHSETKDIKSEHFYRGNHPILKTENIGGVEMQPVGLRFSKAKLYKTYLGNENYSGKEIADINKTLERLSERLFVVNYDRKTKIMVKGKLENRTNRVFARHKLINILGGTVKGATEKELAEMDRGDHTSVSRKSELFVALHPVWVDQIATKFVGRPQGWSARLVEAVGGHPRSVTTAFDKLCEWCMRERSSNHSKFEWYEETLIERLELQNYVGRGKRLQKKIDELIEGVKRLGVILNVERQVVMTKANRERTKYVFSINLQFNNQRPKRSPRVVDDHK